MKTLNKLKEIYQGWKNLITNNQEVKPLAEKRMDICNTCPLQTKGVCDKKKEGKAVTTFVYQDEIRTINTVYKGCGCPLKAKTVNPDSHCPIGKW